MKTILAILVLAASLVSHAHDLKDEKGAEVQHSHDKAEKKHHKHHGKGHKKHAKTEEKKQ